MKTVLRPLVREFIELVMRLRKQIFLSPCCTVCICCSSEKKARFFPLDSRWDKNKKNKKKVLFFLFLPRVATTGKKIVVLSKKKFIKSLGREREREKCGSDECARRHAVPLCNHHSSQNLTAVTLCSVKILFFRLPLE